jgi:nitrate reductase cytochrome c-type subunit
MKVMKKLVTLLFAAILAVSMSMPVFAQESGTAEGQTTAAPKTTKKHKVHKASTKVKKEKKAKKEKKEKKGEEAPPAQ